MENTYWNNKGRFQAEFDNLSGLMPMTGSSDVVAGELIRAANRLAYDFYNNGMGNNTSGAINFLKKNSAISDSLYDTVYPWTTGRVYDGDYDGDPLQLAIEAIIDSTVEMIVRNPQLVTMKNTDDIFNYSDKEQYFDDVDLDEYFYDEDEDEYVR